MKKAIWITPVLLLLMAFSSADGLHSIITSKEDALVNHRFKTFIVVEKDSQTCLGKKSCAFNPDAQMPLHYFTLDLSNEVTKGERRIVIHSLEKENQDDDYDWVLRWDRDEKQIYYGKRKFIHYNDGIFWWMVVRGQNVLLENCQSRKYLKMGKDGSFVLVDSEEDASQWELIHIF